MPDKHCYIYILRIYPQHDAKPIFIYLNIAYNVFYLILIYCTRVVAL